MLSKRSVQVVLYRQTTDCQSVIYSSTSYRMSATNVLPLFWHLSSTDRNVRLDATENLVSSLEAFQSRHFEQKKSNGADSMEVDQPNGDDNEEAEESEDDEDEDGDESGVEVDASDDEDEKRQLGPEEKALAKLDVKFEKDNSEDVRYSIKRLARGLTSSRESSRLGFAVALTEVCSTLMYSVEHGFSHRWSYSFWPVSTISLLRI